MTESPLITIYRAPDCHLCEQARKEIVALSRDYLFTLMEIDVTSDRALHQEYLERIPVVCLNGEELFEHSIDVQALIAVLPRRERSTADTP